MVRGC